MKFHLQMHTNPQCLATVLLKFQNTFRIHNVNIYNTTKGCVPVAVDFTLNVLRVHVIINSFKLLNLLGDLFGCEHISNHDVMNAVEDFSPLGPLKVLFIIKSRVSLLSLLIRIFSSKDRGENSRLNKASTAFVSKDRYTRVLNYRLELNERSEEKEF